MLHQWMSVQLKFVHFAGVVASMQGCQILLELMELTLQQGL